MDATLNLRTGRPSPLALYRLIAGRHKGLLQAWFYTWLLLFPLLQVFHDPWGLAAMGGLFGLLAGQALGASEVMEGSEEFFFTLPARRETLFWSRYLFGALPLLLLLLAGLAFFQWNLPQKAWGLLVETGFTEPYPPPTPISLFGALAIPLSLYTFIFVLGSLFKTPSTAGYALPGGLILATAFALGGYLAESIPPGRASGWGALISLAAPVPFVLLVGFRAYSRKELDQVGGSLSLVEPKRSNLRTLLLFLALLFIFLLLFSMVIQP